MFSAKDKITLHNILEKLNSIGEQLGKKINSNGSKIISIIIISLTVITIGAIIFLSTLLWSSFGKKNTN